MHEPLFERAFQGDAVAQYEIGDKFYNGDGVPQSHERALHWYRKSAAQGNDWGLFNVGKCYLYGKEVRESFDEAQKWFERCAAQGNEWGEKYAKFCHRRQIGSLQDALAFAVSIGETELLSHFIGCTEYYNQICKHTLLCRAAASGTTECARLLLESGCDPNEHDDNPRSWDVLRCAAWEGHVECVRLLLDYGADINYSLFPAPTALALACKRGHLECVRLLLDRGAYVDNTYGIDVLFGSRDATRTALCDAVEAGSEDCVRLLLERGASTNRVNERTANAKDPGSYCPRHCPKEVWEESRKRWRCFQIVKAHEEANKGIFDHIVDVIKDAFS